MNKGSLSTVYDITSFGALSDGKTSCSKAFRQAIAAAVQNGGGTVYVPAGTYQTGPIQMESNITLFLDAGARLIFSTIKEDYPVITSRWEGAEGLTYMPMIYGKNVENVSITGYGTLDGQGEAWWKPFRERTLDHPRPRFVSFEDSSRVLIEGIHLINSPSWTLNPVRCSNVTIDKVTINNPPDSPNTDGINPDSCKNVHISNCHVDVGDDCITIKSGTERSTYKVSCENITVTNCTLVHGHGGVVIGSEMSGGVRNVVISNCVFEGTDRGIRLKTRRGRGGIVEDLRINNLVMKDVMCPIVMHQYYFCGEGGKEQIVWDKAPYPITEATPVFRSIHFSNITAKNAHAAAAFIYGLSEMPIEDLSFDHISISMAEDAIPGIPAMMNGVDPVVKMGFFCCNVKDVSFSHVTIKGHEGAAFQVKNSKKVVFISCTEE
ncbi:MAG: glycoside hydrolase family 28 protein [Clostridia bacterium]|nr:glycoside hydrolase family 28 protein [Clostridia bacterium]